MSQIIKSEAIVLSKLNYGDTSSIVSLFTEEEGKLSAIAKGSRSPKSKYGRIIDPINHLHVIFYKKESREVQLISGAELIDYFPTLKSDLDKLKYAYAVVELVKSLLAEHEVNKTVFRNLVRILSALNTSKEKPVILFGSFFIHLLKEVGYEIQLEKCAICREERKKEDTYYFNFEKGLICGKCKEQAVEIYKINLELLEYLNCLKNNDPVENLTNSEEERAVILLEKYLKYHVQNFTGIQSIKLFN